MTNHIIAFFGSVGTGTVERKDLAFFCIFLLGYCIMALVRKNESLIRIYCRDFFFTWMMEGLEGLTSNGE